jgi:hypothetical protein
MIFPGEVSACHEHESQRLDEKTRAYERTSRTRRGQQHYSGQYQDPTGD